MADQEEQDRMLPIANVGRIMKQILPPTAKISKEAKQTIQECATEFISFVTGEASDKCHKENRKTVNGDDLCWALSSLGFDNYAEVVSRYLHRFREAEREKASQISRDKDGDQSQKSTGISTSKSQALLEFKIIDQMEDRRRSLVESSWNMTINSHGGLKE